MSLNERLGARSATQAIERLATASVEMLQAIHGELRADLWQKFLYANGLFVTCKDLQSLGLTKAQLLDHLSKNIRLPEDRPLVKLIAELDADEGSNKVGSDALQEWVLRAVDSKEMKELSIREANISMALLLEMRSFKALRCLSILFDRASYGIWSPTLPELLTSLKVNGRGTKTSIIMLHVDCSKLALLRQLTSLSMHGVSLAHVSQLSALKQLTALEYSCPSAEATTVNELLKTAAGLPELRTLVLPGAKCGPDSWRHLCALRKLQHAELQELLLLASEKEQEEEEGTAAFTSLRVAKLLTETKEASQQYQQYQRTQ